MATFSVGEIFDRLDQLAPQYGMDPAVAKTLILAENTKNGNIPPRSALFSGDATNKNQTMGLGQVIPTTAEGLKQAGFLPPDWKHDPKNLDSQLSASLAAMKEMKGRQRNPADALELGAMYNGGTIPWEQYKAGKPMNPETTQYLQKMRTSMAEMNMTPQQIEAMAGKPGGISLPAGTRTPGTREGSSSTTTTTSKVFDPAALAGVNSAMGLLQSPGGLFDTAFGALEDRGGAVATAGTDLMGSIMAAGQAAGASAQATATLKAAGEARRAAILTRANLNPEQNANRMDEALNALDVTSAQLEQMKPEIDRRMSVGFFDNPLEFVVNMTRLPGMIGQYNGLVSTQQQALGKYQAAKEITTSAIDMSQAMDADATLTVGAAMDKEALAKAQMESDRTKLALRSKTAAEALQSTQLGLQNFDVSLRALQLSAQSKAEKEGMTSAEAAAKGEQAALSGFNVMVAAAGGETLEPDRFKQLPAEKRAEILATTSSRRFGGDFVSALRFVDKYGNLDNLAVKGQANVRTWVNNTRQAADAEVGKMETAAAAAGKASSFNPDHAKVAALQTLAAQYEKAANGNMRGVSEGNPYKIEYSKLIKTPEFANNSYVQLMAKYGPDGPEKHFVNYDEQDFIKRAVVNASLSGDPALATKKMAADISSFYQTASRQAQMLNKPQLFGLSTPAKIYPVILPAFATGKEIKSVDLGDPSVMENFMTRQVTKAIATNNLSIFAVGEKLENRRNLGLSPFGGQ